MNPIDTLLAYAINSPAKFKTDKEELEYLRSTKPILRDELLTCYQFLEEQGLIEKYKEFRG